MSDYDFWAGCHVDGGCNALHRRDLAIEHKDAAIAEMVAALKDAEEMVCEWGGYAGDYFQKKWDFDGDTAKLRAVIAKHDKATT